MYNDIIAPLKHYQNHQRIKTSYDQIRFLEGKVLLENEVVRCLNLAPLLFSELNCLANAVTIQGYIGLLTGISNNSFWHLMLLKRRNSRFKIKDLLILRAAGKEFLILIS